MQVATASYLEIVDFIAGCNPAAVAKFEASPAASARFEPLMERSRMGALSEEERTELGHFIEVEHIIGMAKAKAKLILTQAKADALEPQAGGNLTKKSGVWVLHTGEPLLMADADRVLQEIRAERELAHLGQPE